MNKQYRVKKSKEIENILKEKKYKSNEFFSLYIKNNPETIHFRYAISVGKKIGNAVTRNRIKRKVTAIIDQLNINLSRGVDVFIIVKPNILKIDFNEMKKQLEYLFKKQKILQGENNV